MTVDIPVNADVYCADGLCGRSSCVIVDPGTRTVTHVVVRGKGLLALERLVPVDQITKSTPQSIHLCCTQEELSTMDAFVDEQYTASEMPFLMYGANDYRMWPYSLPGLEALEAGPAGPARSSIPPGEEAIRRGAEVEATDGPVGHVDEFLVDPASERITHLVLRQGHLWGLRDVTIPASAIERVVGDVVRLKLSKHEVGLLPPRQSPRHG